ncbi:MAG: hypothetical protein ACTSRG_22710 [Candidatus Helarchaeota archaeon]
MDFEEKQIISTHELINNLEEVPKSWKLEDWEISDKIKRLNKQVYLLKRCRRKQPKLFIHEKVNGEDKFRIFDKWTIRFKHYADKNPLYIADSWHSVDKFDLKLLEKTFKLNDKLISKIEKTINENGK